MREGRGRRGSVGKKRGSKEGRRGGGSNVRGGEEGRGDGRKDEGGKKQEMREQVGRGGRVSRCNKEGGQS